MSLSSNFFDYVHLFLPAMCSKRHTAFHTILATKLAHLLAVCWTKNMNKTSKKKGDNITKHQGFSQHPRHKCGKIGG